MSVQQTLEIYQNAISNLRWRVVEKEANFGNLKGGRFSCKKWSQILSTWRVNTGKKTNTNNRLAKNIKITFASRDFASRVLHRIASLPASRDMGHSSKFDTHSEGLEVCPPDLGDALSKNHQNLEEFLCGHQITQNHSCQKVLCNRRAV